MTTALAHREQPTGGALSMWDAEQLDVIKNLICPGASDAELALFGQVCQRTGLDPFSRQIYGLMRRTRVQVNGQWESVERLSIQTSIDGFRLIAQRSKEYAGQDGPYWCGEDGEWRDVWLSKTPPAAAKVGVYRTGWTRPVTGIATWAEYVQTTREGKPTGQWASMPAHMLAKCAEALALRKAFPAELSNLYSRDEMEQANRPEPVEQEPMHAAGSVVSGEVVSGWTDAAQARWASGEAEARRIGADIPEMPPADATREQVMAAMRKLGDSIVSRRQLVSDLQDAVKRVVDLGGSFDMPEDLPLIPDAEVRELIQHARLTIEQAEAA